jgi:hypothetical protein
MEIGVNKVMAIGGFGVAFYKGYSYQGHHTSTL